MIVTRTPFRVSLFGGGTDYPQWYKEHGGAVLGMAINKHCYISVRTLPPFFEHKHRIVYSKIENVRDVSEIDHPSVRAILTEWSPEEGLEIHHDGDLPARSGIASSSAFTVGLLNALYSSRGQRLSKQALAREAIRIEQDVIGENVGSQDQIWAAHGGFNRIDFMPGADAVVTPVVMEASREKRLKDCLMLFFSGLSRCSTIIAGKKIKNLKSKSRSLHVMREMVDEAYDIMGSPTRDMKEIGGLLHESWLLKRDLAEGVSNGEIDDIYEAAREAGAVGGKVLGAGGGGFVLLYVEPEHQDRVRQRLSRLIEVSFDVDTNGSTVVVYQPDGFAA